MFKLFVTIVAISSGGSVSTSLVVTDYNDGGSCKALERSINEAPASTLPSGSGYSAQITMKARCTADGGPPRPEDLFGQFFQNMGRVIQGGR